MHSYLVRFLLTTYPIMGLAPCPVEDVHQSYYPATAQQWQALKECSRRLGVTSGVETWTGDYAVEWWWIRSHYEDLRDCPTLDLLYLLPNLEACQQRLAWWKARYELLQRQQQLRDTAGLYKTALDLDTRCREAEELCSFWQGAAQARDPGAWLCYRRQALREVLEGR